jgi:hypothetical protein
MNNSQVDEGRVSPRARVDLGAAGAIITDSPSPIPDTGSSDLAAFPSANAGTAAAIIAGMDFTGDDGRKPVPAVEYPVPDRSEQMNRRIASHEIGHCFSARALGNNVFAVTIIPDRRPGGYEGMCMRSGPPSQNYHLEDSATDETDEVVDICSRLERLMPEIGTARVEAAEFFVRAQLNVIELVAGRVCEQILYPDLPDLGAAHDRTEAKAFAAVAVAQPGAIEALIEYAEAAARALLLANLPIVHALIDGLVERGILTGDEVDQIIRDTIAAKAAADERARRAAWNIVEKNAADFAARGLEA